ncbi:nucleolar protein 58 [Nematocida sp. AWRm80]|nr:nucleolar protein 58 [Nematocida sp. AWRm80]
MHILQETPVGYALFKESPLEIEELFKFNDTKSAIESHSLANEGQLPEYVLEGLVQKGIKQLGVSNTKVKGCLEEYFQKNGKTIKIILLEEIEETVRQIHKRLPELLNISEKDLARSSLLLAHALSREKLKLTPLQLDLVLVQTIKVLDKLDKDINNKFMKIKEWYLMYYPEHDQGDHTNQEYLDEIYSRFDMDVTDDLKKANEQGLGGEMAKEDQDLLKDSMHSVLQMYGAREKLQENLHARMVQIAPNLLELVGDHMGARLIAHAGSLSELARKPASTIQVMGAEKALFKALKEKKSTPKYGYIYNTTYIGQAPQSIKGAIARTLASKISLAARCDMYEEDKTGEYGKKVKHQLLSRIEILNKKASKTKSSSQPARTDKFAFKRPQPAPLSASSKRHKD